MISLAAEMHVLCNLCQRTGGDFHVALNEDHYKELLLKHVPPRVIVQDSSTNQNDNGAFQWLHLSTMLLSNLSSAYRLPYLWHHYYHEYTFGKKLSSFIPRAQLRAVALERVCTNWGGH